MSVRKATRADREVLAAALGSAFSEDPMFKWILGPATPIEQRMRILFDGVLRQALRKDDHLVFVTPDGSGAAVWRGVDGWKASPGEMLRFLPSMARACRGRLPRFLKAVKVIEDAHPSEPHYYLEVLGTRRDRQGKGLGSAVLAPMLERCDREGLPAYLESSNPANVPFYLRHGFQPRETISFGNGAPPCTTMWRQTGT
jgi:GNAT superfamily N-acetyltransferase